MSDSTMIPANNTEQTQESTNVESRGYFISAGDGKGIAIPENFRMVKVAEVIKGKKGKGKTIAFSVIPMVKNPIPAVDCAVLMPMILETVSDLQKDIVVRMSREGMKTCTDNDLNIAACFAEWTNKSFNAETVGAWFDNDVESLLAYQICVARGFDPEKLEENKDQFKLVSDRVAAYRASYIETASKFPSLNPAQCVELLRVMDLLELTGAIAARIREKISPKETKDSLGF